VSVRGNDAWGRIREGLGPRPHELDERAERSSGRGSRRSEVGKGDMTSDAEREWVGGGTGESDAEADVKSGEVDVEVGVKSGRGREATDRVGRK
jgi:hypothetical protein